MKRRSLIASVAFLAVLASGGCASGVAYTEYANKIQSVAPDLGRIYVYRTSPVAAAVQPRVRLNGEVVGKAKPRGFFFIDREPGEYELSTSTEVKRSLRLTLDANEEKYVRLEPKLGVLAGHIKPVLVDPEVGKQEIAKTRHIGGI